MNNRQSYVQMVPAANQHFVVQQPAPPPVKKRESGGCMLVLIILMALLTLINSICVFYLLGARVNYTDEASLRLFRKYLHPTETPSGASVTIGAPDDDCSRQGRFLCVHGQSNFTNTMSIGDSLNVCKDAFVTGTVLTGGRVSSQASIHSPAAIETPNQQTAMWRTSSVQINAIADDGFKKTVSPADTASMLALVNQLQVHTFQWDSVVSAANYKLPVNGVQIGLSSISASAAGSGSLVSTDVPNVDLALQRVPTGTVSTVAAIDLAQVVAALVGSVQSISARLPQPV